MATRHIYIKTARTGGGAAALDAMDGLTGGKGGVALATGDIAHVYEGGIKYEYWCDIAGGAAEIDPAVIVPDANPGNINWELQSVYKEISEDPETYSHTPMTISVADESEITLDTAKTGWGTAMAGDNEEFIQFRFTAAGVVTVVSNTANAINTDTDGFLCVYDAGTGIRIKNRLGATKDIRYVVNYSA